MLVVSDDHQQMTLVLAAIIRLDLLACSVHSAKIWNLPCEKQTMQVCPAVIHFWVLAPRRLGALPGVEVGLSLPSRCRCAACGRATCLEASLRGNDLAEQKYGSTNTTEDLPNPSHLFMLEKNPFFARRKS
jgi:hypothetical protein